MRVLRQTALSCAETVELICFIVGLVFVLRKKGCPHHEKTALSYYLSFPLMRENMFIILLQVQV